MGSYFIREILERTEERILATARDLGQVVDWGERVRWQELDVRDFAGVEALSCQLSEGIREVRVVYLAAFHHPDQVEKQPKVAWDVNVTALSHFLNCIGDVECFFYPSTDSVYGEGGKEKKFSENDILCPRNRYGKQKAVAEALVTGYGHHVVRYPFLIAPSLLKHKKHFYDVIVETIRSGKTMQMFADSYRSSLDFGTAAGLTISLMEKAGKVPGIVNVAGDEALSKYEVGCMIARRHGVPENLIQPITVGESHGIFEAPRAMATIMDNRLLKNILELQEVRLKL